MESENTKKVTILLTKYSDNFSRFISFISKNGYSHASISLDEDEEVFYSFNHKGFVIEKPHKKRPAKRKPDSVWVRMQVPEEAYDIIRREIDVFMANSEKYTYAKLGVILCLLRIPHKFKNKYFCSQFVAEVLAAADVITLHKKESLYLPNHLIDQIEFMFAQRQIVHNMI